VHTLLPIAVLSLLAGAANSIAGGGTLLTFPALIGLGVPPIVANATSTVALVPGSLSSMFGYRDALRGSRPWVVAFAVPSVIGGAVGAWLLVVTPERRFSTIVPFLVLGATFLFLAQRPLLAALAHIKARARASDAHSTEPAPTPHTHTAVPAPSGAFIVAQFGVAIYGGYFGAAAGIVMLGALGLMGLTDIHQMNGLKNWAAVCFNGVAAATFIAAGLVDWPIALVMATGAAIGGWSASRIAQRVRPAMVRSAVGIIGIAASVWLFLRP
jgi:uncharacterized membrane protein YfcA